MKFKVSLLTLLLLSTVLWGQNFQNVVSEAMDDICFGNESLAADPVAESVVDQIMEQMALKRNFKIRQCPNIQNALAKIEEDDNNNLELYILYDPNWLSQISRKSETDWASIGVLAHEIGHLLLNHALNKRGSNPRWELDADRFAGLTLARMGSTLEEAKSAFQSAPIQGNATHPARDERLNEIEIGWMKFNNPTGKKILLTADTPERDVSQELIINRYIKEIGGNKNLNEVRQLKFSEEIIETIGEVPSKNKANFTIQYDYEQVPNKITVHFPAQKEIYQIINNDSVYWKYEDEKNWKAGAPPIGGNLKLEDYEFIEQTKPITANFFEYFLFISNPEIAIYKGRRRIGDEECFVLELPENKIDIGNLQKKGKRIAKTTNHYYSVETGLLYAIEEKEQVAIYRGGSLKSKENRVKEIILSAYQPVNNVLFPSIMNTTRKVFNSNELEEKDKRRHEKRTITNLQIN